MLKLLSISILAILTVAKTLASELPCPDSFSVNSQLVSEAALAEMFTSTISDTKMCFDISQYKNNKSLLEDFKLLDIMGAFDEKGCLKENRNSNTEHLVTQFIEKNIEFQKLSMVAAVDPDSNEIQVIYTNSSNPEFRNKALTNKDKWQIAGGTFGGMVIGAVLSEKIYEGQSDKRKHWIYGAAISGLTSGVTYLVLEKTSLSEVLNLSYKTKKNIITYSGPLMSLIVGIAKEVLYDKRYPKKHTVDPNDAAATALGGAVLTPLVINIVF